MLRTWDFLSGGSNVKSESFDALDHAAVSASKGLIGCVDGSPGRSPQLRAPVGLWRNLAERDGGLARDRVDFRSATVELERPQKWLSKQGERGNRDRGEKEKLDPEWPAEPDSHEQADGDRAESKKRDVQPGTHCFDRQQYESGEDPEPPRHGVRPFLWNWEDESEEKNNVICSKAPEKSEEVKIIGDFLAKALIRLKMGAMAQDLNEERRVLVADDDLMIRKMIIKVLEREGYAVEEAKDGAEAIEHCQTGSFDAILLDMMMPRIDGFHVLEWMREHRPDLIDRVLVMTAFTRTAAQRTTSQIPIVYKPFDLHDLVEQVRERAEAARKGSITPDVPESDASI